MSNPCGWTASTFQDLADLLCTVYNQTTLNGTSLTIILNDVVTPYFAGSTQPSYDLPSYVNITKVYTDTINTTTSDTRGVVTATKVELDGVTTTVNGVSTRLGSNGTRTVLGASSSMDADLSTVLSVANTINSNVGSGSGSSVFDKLSVVLGNIVASFTAVAGGSEDIAIAQLIAALWNAPPRDLLTAGGGGFITSGAPIAITTGAYGVLVTLTVPSWWGKAADTIPRYYPPIAYLSWLKGVDNLGDPIAITTDVFEVYPMPSNADSVAIDLKPGVTGEYEWLQFHL